MLPKLMKLCAMESNIYNILLMKLCAMAGSRHEIVQRFEQMRLDYEDAVATGGHTVLLLRKPLSHLVALASKVIRNEGGCASHHDQESIMRGLLCAMYGTFALGPTVSPGFIPTSLFI